MSRIWTDTPESRTVKVGGKELTLPEKKPNYPLRRLMAGLGVIGVLAAGVQAASLVGGADKITAATPGRSEAEEAAAIAKAERVQEKNLRRFIKQERFRKFEDEEGRAHLAFRVRGGDTFSEITSKLNPWDPAELAKDLALYLPDPGNPGYLPVGTELVLPEELTQEISQLQDYMSFE